MLDFFKNKKDTKAEDKAKQPKATAAELDDYMASLWVYNLEAPEMGMRSREELEKLFQQNEFKFVEGAYQPGELCFLAGYSDRMLGAMMQTRAEELKRIQALPEAEQTEEDKAKLAQLEELVTVTLNRRRMVVRALGKWIRDLPSIHYYASTVTNEPYIDASGHVYLYTDKRAVEQAGERAESEPDVLMAALSPADLEERLYLNGCENLTFNDGVLSFTASREDIFANDEARANDGTDVPENNRAIRYFMLTFIQLLKSPQEGDRQPILQQLEAQLAPRLMQAELYFKLLNDDDEKTTFAVLSDSTGLQAIACYTDAASVINEDGRFIHKAMAFLPIAQNLLENGGELSGIIVNPGGINFFLDKNWLNRLCSFAAYFAKLQADKANNEAAQEKTEPEA